MNLMETLTRVINEVIGDVQKHFPQLSQLMDAEDLRQEICCKALEHDAESLNPSDWGVFYVNVYSDILELLCRRNFEADWSCRLADCYHVMVDSAEIEVIKHLLND